MYQFSYAEVVEDSGRDARQRERQAFERAIDLLKRAEERGANSSEAAEALFFLQRLWTILTTDLASDENALPASLRASLISIGIWIMKEVEAIRSGRTRSFLGLIDINTIISEGLR
jgi:flagellar protein FlaF